MRDIIDRITEGRRLPKGADAWALKATDFAGRTRGGFRWPSEGWVTAPGPFAPGGPCPSHEGDGLCVARTYVGLASGGHRALALLLVAYAAGDVLGEDRDKVRVRRVFVVERLDGEDVLRRYGANASLSSANLRGASLDGANLAGADLTGAYLTGAYLAGANLTGASLRGANLAGANLYDADLRDADMDGASLYGADLTGANLYGAVLDSADLTGANLAGTYLRGASLRDANLRDANLYGANLRDADLTGTDLASADLASAYAAQVTKG